MATNITEREMGEITVLEVSGDLDQLYEEQMHARSEDLLTRGRSRLIFDVRQLKFVDSAGVGSLVSLFKRARSAGGDLKLVGLCGQPRDLFHLLRFDRAFELFDSIEAATSAFAAKKA